MRRASLSGIFTAAVGLALLVAVVRRAGVAAIALVMLWRQPALVSRALGFAPRLAGYADRVRALEVEIYSFAARRRDAIPALVAAEVGFHALGVAEAYLTVWLLGSTPTLMT